MKTQKGCEDSYSGTSGRRRESPEDAKKPVVELELSAGGGNSMSQGPEAATVCMLEELQKQVHKECAGSTAGEEEEQASSHSAPEQRKQLGVFRSSGAAG